MIHRELIKGSTPMLVLSVCADGPTYGYEIVRRIEQRSEGILEGKEGTIYPILHQLESARLLKSHTETVSGRKRKYYSLTRKGKAELVKMVKGWKDFSKAVELSIENVKLAVQSA